MIAGGYWQQRVYSQLGHRATLTLTLNPNPNLNLMLMKDGLYLGVDCHPCRVVPQWSIIVTFVIIVIISHRL